jgi:HEAT repeat protein
VAAALLAAGGALALTWVPRSQRPAAPPASLTPEPQPVAASEPERPAPAVEAPRPAAPPAPKPAPRLFEMATLGPAGTTPPPAKREAPAAPAAAMRRDTAGEEDHRRALALANEVGLGGSSQVVLGSYAAYVRDSVETFGAARLTDATPLVEVLPEVHSLPLHYGSGCQLSAREAGDLELLSRKLRIQLNRLAAPGPDGRRPDPARLREALRSEVAGRRPEWLRSGAVPALVQILMAEEAPLRRLLVELLADVPGPKAAVALAQRAAFDLDSGVRAAAVEALRGRPAKDYQDVLLKALRYPWGPPADHAADALVALRLRDTVPTLVTLLKLPDPAGPLPLRNGRVVIQEVVRTKHLTNCLLCHPPAATANEPALGLDPVATIPVTVRNPALARAAQRLGGTAGAHSYQHDGSSLGGPAGGAGGGTTTVRVPALIRGDITFLRQDFSAPLPAVPVGGPALRPPALPGLARGAGSPTVATQRYDFVLRTHALSRKEAALLKNLFAERTTYPQREAVLFALRELTGQDAGSTTEAWQELFPRAEAEVRGARLARDLLRAGPLQREFLLNRYRDAEGAAYTHALAGAVGGLKGAEREKAREALAQRLTRMTADTLRDKLQDEDAEVRHAAVAACARKRDRALVPDLIALLEGEPLTARLAEESLDELTGQHLRHPAAWKAWWQKNGAAATEAGGAGG